MESWNDLSLAVTEKAGRVQALRRERFEKALARQAYQRWAHGAVSTVIDDLHDLLRERLSAVTTAERPVLQIGKPYSVSRDAHQPSPRVLTLLLAQDSVDLYAQWTPGCPPTVHLLLSRVRRGRPLRMICVPGGWLATTPEKANYRIVPFGSSHGEVCLDELAQRAVRLLTMA